MMSGQMIYTNKFLCISFAANSEIFFFFFFFFFSDWFFVIELVIQVYQLKYFLPINPPLSSYIYIYIFFFFFFWGGDVCMYCRLNKFIYLFINFFLMPLFLFVSAALLCF